MPVFASITPTFLIWEVKESFPELLSLLPADVPMPAYKSESRQVEWVVTHLLVQQILGRFALVRHHESGAPYLDGISQHISISHTKGYVAVSMTEEPLGIDIERISNRAQRVRSRYMDENEGFSDVKAPEVEATLIWSAKEAVFKILPAQDGINFLTQIRTEKFQYADGGSFGAMGKCSCGELLYTVRYKIYPEFVLTFASNRDFSSQ